MGKPSEYKQCQCEYFYFNICIFFETIITQKVAFLDIFTYAMFEGTASQPFLHWTVDAGRAEAKCMCVSCLQLQEMKKYANYLGKFFIKIFQLLTQILF